MEARALGVEEFFASLERDLILAPIASDLPEGAFCVGYVKNPPAMENQDTIVKTTV
jgi:hypothetical protein